MAFSIIEWDGTGVVANCDGLSDSIGGTWAELGGGGISYNTDTYLTGTGSIGHVYASKSGFGYYTTNATYNFDVGGAEEGQLIYAWVNVASTSAFDILSNNGFSWVVGTDTNNYRTYKLAGSDDDNGWGGGWKLFVFDPTIPGSIADVGTFNPATINMMGLWMDTIVSVRADTVFIDQIAIARGLRATDGVGTMDELVTYCAKTLASRAWGVFQYKGRFFYSSGSLTIGNNVNQTANTSLEMSNAIIGYEVSEFYHDTNGWSPTHPITYNKMIAEKHASFTTEIASDNTSLFGHTDARLSMSKDSGATYVINGGSFEELSALDHDADWDMQNAILANCASRTISGGLFNYNTVTLCDPLIVSTNVTGCTINNPTTTGATAATINFFTDFTFNSDGTGYGVDVSGTPVTTNSSMNWDNLESGYVVGTTGTDVGLTPTGNETILVDVDSGITLTINVSATASTPSVANSGLGQVDIIAGQKTMTFTGLVVGSDVVLLVAGTDTVIDAVDQTVGTTWSYSYSTPIDFDYGIIKPGYVTIYRYNRTMSSETTSEIPIAQTIDRNYGL